MWYGKCIILFMSFFSGFCIDEYCMSNSASDCQGDEQTSLYSKASSEKYNKYITAVYNAEKNYIECNSTGCKCFQDTMNRDLKTFKKNGINKELIDAARSRGTFYQIIDGKLYREKECMFPSRCAGIEHFLLQVIRNLTNIELVVNTRDYPQSSKHFGRALPIFSFSKTPDYHDIMYPAWVFWEGGPAISLYPRGLGRWDQHRESLNKAEAKTPWSKKQNKAFFRGSRTSSERDNLILLSRKQPDLVDAQYTKNQAWKSEKDTLDAPPASEVPLESHCTYKYLFNYRGVAASFRHKHLFLCRSLVFHVGDEWNEFYYDSMRPWIHFIPVPKDATQSDLQDLIFFAKDNDNISQKIANRGRDFIWNKLKMRDVKCYWRRLLKNYANLLSYKPKLDESLIRIRAK